MVIKLSLDTVDYICYSMITPHKRNTKLMTKKYPTELIAQ